MTHISVFDFNDIFFVFVDGCQQFSLCFDEVLSDLGFVQEAGFFLEDEIWIGDSIPERISMSSIFFFFIVEFQWFLMELSVLPGSILVISAHLLPWAVCAKNRIHS